MQASNTDVSIRAISLIRRVGSIVVVGVIFLIIFFNVYRQIKEKFLISDLRNIHKNGVSKLARVDEEYKIQTINNNPRLTFHYSFSENEKTYKGEYILYHYLPKETDALTKIFTVHYLKADPEKNSLNIEAEITRIETKINESSTIWFIVKILTTLLFAFILLGQIISLISEIKNINTPIDVPDYLKKTDKAS